MKRKIALWVILLMQSVHILSQCPASITFSTPTVSPATCPSNGQIVVHSSAEGASGVVYQITASDVGYTTTPQSPNTFSSLQPGKYTIKVSCNALSNTTEITVPNQYTAPGVTAAITNLCSNFQTGGTITLTGSGSSVPLQYAVLLSNDPNAPQSSFTYITTNTFNVTAFGTYQVRVKDNCGNYATRTIQVLPTSPKVNYSITQTSYPSCNTINQVFTFKNASNNQTINPVNSGYRVEIWESASTGCPGLPTSTPTQTKILSTSSVQANFNLSSATRSYYYKITTPCGEVTTGCQSVTPFTLTAAADVMVGCSSRPGSTNQIGFDVNGQPQYTVVFTGYSGANATGSVVFGPTSYGPQTNNYFAVPKAASYKYTLTDGCGNTVSGTTTTPTAAPAIQGVTTAASCTNILGTTRTTVRFTGLIPDLYYMGPGALIQLVSTSTGATYNAVDFTRRGMLAVFNDVTPGNYRLVLTSPQSPGVSTCNTELNVTVPASNLFAYTLTTSVTQLCGGAGTIQASATTNSTGSVSFSLLNSSGTQIASNASGTFANLAAGTYTVVGSLDNSACLGTGNYSTSKTVTVLNGNDPPQITKQVAMVCEPGNTSGMAAFAFAGVKPFKLEMKLKTDPETAYNVIGTNVSDTYILSNLTVGATYNIRLSDNCGRSTTSEITIAPLNTIAVLTNSQPCVGSSYTLAVDDLPGATYAWSFNGGGTISTESALHFSSYQASSDGTYTCTVSFGTCVTRVLTFNLNSTNCGAGLSVNLQNISAVISNNNLRVNWESTKEENNSRFEVEASRDGKNFVTIGTVNSKAENGNSDKGLSYSFELPVSGIAKILGALAILSLFGFAKDSDRKRKLFSATIFIAFIVAMVISCSKQKDTDVPDGNSLYIRIASIDKDGKKEVSKVVKVVQE